MNKRKAHSRPAKVNQVGSSSEEESEESVSSETISSDSEEAVYATQKKKSKQSKSSLPQGRAIPSSSRSDNTYVESAESEEEQLKRSIGLVANYFLTAECKKVPVKRADLGKVVLKKHMQKDVLQTIIEKASVNLKHVYGYKIEELKEKKNQYILLNTLSSPINVMTDIPLTVDNDVEELENEDNLLESIEPTDDRQGLLLLVLTVIYMMDGDVEEGTMISFLKNLGINLESKDHNVFGNTKKLLEEFSRQGYIELTINKDGDPPTKRYTWGERAHLQVCKKSILEFVCKVYGNVQPRDWTDHYNKLMGVRGGSTSGGSSVELMEVDV